MKQIIECVPNFSEGRDRVVIDKIVKAIADARVTVDGKEERVKVLDVDPGEATNRTVVTFVGSPEAVLEAANAELAEEVAQETKTEESVEAARAKVTKKDAVTFNIEFYLPDDPETEIEPLVPISVTFGNIALDGDTLEVYHSDDSQEGEVQVEKVLDGVENTDVLTVNGLQYRIGMSADELTGLAGEPDVILQRKVSHILQMIGQRHTRYIFT